MRDLWVRVERAFRRRTGRVNGKWTIAPFTLTEEEIADLRSLDPGPVETAFYGLSGRVAHKWTHYLPLYDEIFAPSVGKPIRMLEIGVNRGGSLELWRTVFGPDATIMGIDIDPAAAGKVDHPNRVMIGSQDDPDFLRHVVAEMGGVDLVLDDGSHIGRHVIASFKALFPLLSQNGRYVIEDLQTSYWPGIHEGGFKRKGTAVEFLKTLVDEINAPFHGNGQSDLYRDQISSIRFFSAMAVIDKCPPKPRTGHLKRGVPAAEQGR